MTAMKKIFILQYDTSSECRSKKILIYSLSMQNFELLDMDLNQCGIEATWPKSVCVYCPQSYSSTVAFTMQTADLCVILSQGFGIQTQSEMPACYFVFTEVEPDGKAAEGGLLKDDILLSINEEECLSHALTVSLIQSAGDRINLIVQSTKESQHLQVRLQPLAAINGLSSGEVNG
ncbi:hypothetical protein HOLleu_30276 [Holothuria leucospilota]|uniref:PDZ domain-containing protein n=1 Tax=Holothuria leucospilota TaxID=206669 RepID=A0A9Q1BK34_HOLLE|nr:hypothetical protein HOLleu_30276 [Holothuria leucospilota]